MSFSSFTSLARLGGLGGLKVTKEVSKEGFFATLVEAASMVPPEVLELLARKNLTILELLERLKNKPKYRRVVRNVYALLGMAKAFASLYPKWKVDQKLRPDEFRRMMDEWIPKAKQLDSEGYKTLLLLRRLADKYPHWFDRQIREWRRLLLGE